MTVEVPIVFEDEDLFVINKPAGLKVHAAHPNDLDYNLVTWLSSCGRPLSRSNPSLNPFRPGIVHRLDQWTSGLLLVAKTDAIHDHLEKIFLEHSVKKKYKALLGGRLKQKSLVVETAMARDPKRRTRFKAYVSNGDDSRTAKSHFREIAQYHLPFTLAEVEIFTGRTHQIRAQARYLNTPVLGDDLYGFHFSKVNEIKNLEKKYKELGIFYYLQAAELSFTHPRSAQKLDLKLDLPNYFKEIIRILE